MKKITIVRKPKLEIYQDSKNEWRWKIEVVGKIIGASSEGYKNRIDCVNNILNVEKRITYLRENDLII